MHNASFSFVVGRDGRYADIDSEKDCGETFNFGRNSKAGTISAILGERRKDSGMRINSS